MNWTVGGLTLDLKKKIQINYHVGVTSVAFIQLIRNTVWTFGFSGFIKLLKYHLTVSRYKSDLRESKLLVSSTSLWWALSTTSDVYIRHGLVFIIVQTPQDGYLFHDAFKKKKFRPIEKGV